MRKYSLNLVYLCEKNLVLMNYGSGQDLQKNRCLGLLSAEQISVFQTKLDSSNDTFIQTELYPSRAWVFLILSK